MNFKTCLFYFTFFSTFLFGQITGTVVDQSTGKPISDVNITSGKIGTATNESGEFSLDVPTGTELEFSHIAYKTFVQSAENGMYIALTSLVIKSDEILVRAGLTDESLQKVAASVTIFSEENIRHSNADHFQTLTDQIPNLNWAGGTSRPRYFQIRGIGERSHYFGEGAPNFSVGFVLDDMDLSGLGMLGQLFDLNQIEIFKGPQSSVYGSNAIGGLISLRSNDPTDEPEIATQVRAGSDKLVGSSYLLNMKLVDGLSMRLMSDYNYSDGFRENLTQNVTNTNKRVESFSRLKLNYTGFKKLNLLTTIIYSEMKNGYDVWAPDNNEKFKTYSDAKGEDSQLTYGYSVRGHYHISDNIQLISITSFTETDLVHAYDGDWADSAYWHDNHGFDPADEGWSYSFYDKNEKNRANLTQEMRISFGSLILGGFSKHLKEQDNAAGYLFGGVATDATSHYNFKAKAGYLQFGTELSQSLKLNANVRYEQNQYDYTGTSRGLNDNWEKVGLPSVTFKTDESMLGYRISLQYLSDEKSSFYGTASQGYKSGGVNQQPYLADESRPYDPEFIQNFEFGLKWKTDSYRTQLSAFSSTRKDQHVSVSSQQVEGDPNSFLFYISNAGSGTIQGSEWEHIQTISQFLSFNASLGYLKTWVDKFTYQSADGDAFGGDREAAMSPKVTGSFGLQYKNETGLFASITLSYKDEYYFSDSHDQKSEPYSLLNLNVGKSFGKTNVSLWVRNALDERYVTRGFYFGLIPPNYPDQLWKSYGDPRQVGLTIDYNF